MESKNFVTNNVLYLKYLTNTSFFNRNYTIVMVLSIVNRPFISPALITDHPSYRPIYP